MLAVRFCYFDGNLTMSSSELVSPLKSCDEGEVAITEYLADGWTTTDTDPVSVTEESLPNGPCISNAISLLWINFQRFHDKLDGPLDMK